MTKKFFLCVRIAVLFAAAVLVAGCYAPLTNQQGHLDFGLQFDKGARVAGTSEVIVLVVNSDFKDNFAETLNLISKGYHATSGLTGSDADRLTTLAKQLATSGLVKFGGFPFYQTTMTGASGQFTIPGVPSERDYYVKLFVFKPNYDFKVENIDQDFAKLIQAENLVFSTETYTSDTAWQSWVPVTGQPAVVSAGQSAVLNVTLTTSIP
jgi:hypothetical protein